jgi:hypothetical protein
MIRDSSVSIVTRLWAGQPGFHSQQVQEIFLFSIASRSALGPIQPRIQCVLGALPPGVRRQRPGANHLHLVMRSRMVELYLQFPICLHGRMLSCGGNLPFIFGRRPFQISIGPSTVLTEGVSGFSQAFHVHAGTVPQINHDHFLLYQFEFINEATTGRCAL